MPEFSEAIDRTGAEALIPTEEASEVIKALPGASAALTLMRQTTMSSKVKTQPVLSALPASYFVNGDSGLKQTTAAEWEGMEMTAEEIATIVPIPEAVIDDADFDVWNEIRPYIVEAIGARLDGAVLFQVDKPVSWPAGIVAGATAAGNAVTAGSITDEHSNTGIALDIGGEGGVMNLVEEDGYDVSGFAARTRIKARLRGQRDTVGTPIYQASTQEGSPSRLYEEQIAFSDRNGAWDQAVDLIGGDWSQAIIGIRQDITYKILDQGVISDADGKVILNLAQQDQVALRVVFRAGYCVSNPVNRMQPEKANRFPFGVLLNGSAGSGSGSGAGSGSGSGV